MNNLIEIAITMMVIMVGDKVYEKYQPDNLEMHLSNGEVSYVMINKNNYSCPKSCGANHFHETIISDTNIDDPNYKLFYDPLNSYLKLNNLDIVDIFKIKTEKVKKNKKITTKRERLEMEYFINKISLK